MDCEMSFFYVTTPDEAIANQIARSLLAQGLVGCANIIPGITSLYPWQGEIECSTECILILKTKSAFASTLQTSIEKMHPYHVACIAEIKLATLNDRYHDWLIASLGS